MKIETIAILTLAITLVFVSAHCISTQKFINQLTKDTHETQSSNSSH